LANLGRENCLFFTNYAVKWGCRNICLTFF